MEVPQKSLGKKDAEKNAGKYKIQLSSLEMGCYTDLTAFPFGNFADTDFPFSSNDRRHIQYSQEIEMWNRDVK